jgi:Helix-turn-helix domain
MTAEVNVMTEELKQPLCPCFGKLLREFRDEARMGIEEFAKRMDSTVEDVDEVERGRRTVSPEWALLADRVLHSGGGLSAEAGDCISFHAGLIADAHATHQDGYACPVRLSAAFIADAA